MIRRTRRHTLTNNKTNSIPKKKKKTCTQTKAKTETKAVKIVDFFIYLFDKDKDIESNLVTWTAFAIFAMFYLKPPKTKINWLS